jgi:O-antigen/teichoic acid export membrane protein
MIYGTEKNTENLEKFCVATVLLNNAGIVLYMSMSNCSANEPFFETKKSILILCVANIGNGCTFIFQVLCGRELEPAGYGVFNSVNSILMLITLCTCALPFVVSKALLEMPNTTGSVREGLLRYFLLRLFFVSFLIAFGWYCLNVVFPSLFHLSTITVFYVSVSCILTFIIPVFLGILQKNFQFMLIAVVLTGLSVLKILLLVCFIIIFSPIDVSIPFLCDFLSGLLIVSALWGLLRKEFRSPAPPPAPALIRNSFLFFLPAMATSLGVGSLGNLDIILAKQFCSAESTGLYAAAAVMGRIPFFATQILAGVLFPIAVKEVKEGKSALRHLVLCGILVLGLGGLFTLAVWAGGDFFLTILYGGAYAGAASLFVVACMTNTLLALGNIVFMYCLALQRYAFLNFLALGVLGICVSVIFFFHESPMLIARCVLTGVACIVGSTLAWLGLRRGGYG